MKKLKKVNMEYFLYVPGRFIMKMEGKKRFSQINKFGFCFKTSFLTLKNLINLSLVKKIGYGQYELTEKGKKIREHLVKIQALLK